MIILTTAIGYGPGDLSIFWDSLIETGYKGKVVVVGDAKCLKDRGAIIIPDPGGQYSINFRRWKAYSEFLKDVDEPVVITDIRDVMFQKNPEDYMPTKGVNVFEEGNIHIKNCRFNSRWMNGLNINKWNDKKVICAGITSGYLKEYAQKMWDDILRLNVPDNIPTDIGGDQAIHNNLIYSGFDATIHKNSDSEVYTVGRLPEGLSIDDNDYIRNKSGNVPCMIHMYDRHVNLTVSIIKRLKLRVELKEAI